MAPSNGSSAALDKRQKQPARAVAADRRRTATTVDAPIANEPDVAAEIRTLCSESALKTTAYRSAAAAVIGSLEKVIAAEAYLKDAAISLAQEQKLSVLLDEMHEVARALATCSGLTKSHEKAPSGTEVEVLKPALPQWWFALSEMLLTTEREIEFLVSIGRGQPHEAAARQLCNLVVRVLRKHYHRMFDEAETWMSVAD